MMPDAKKRDDMGRVADVLPTMQGGNGNGETDHSKIAETTLCALRGFGGFEVRWGGRMGGI